MTRPTRVLVWSGGIVLATLLLLGATAFFLAQTRPGHDFALRAALAQSDRFVNGDLQVEGIRSDGLLRGFTLRGVRILDTRGRLFFEADSVRVRYSFRGILRREVTLVPAELWRPRVVLETLHGDENSNLQRIFASGDTPAVPEVETDSESGGGLSLVLRDLAVHDGSFLIRAPVEDEAAAGRFLTEEVEGFPGLHRVISFTAIQARIAEADLLRPGAAGERVQVEELSMVGRILDEPFLLEDFRGQIHRVGTSLGISADRIWLAQSELSGAIGYDWGDPEGNPTLELALLADPVSLEDFQWLDERIPDGEGRLALRLSGPLAEGEWRFHSMDMDLEGSRVRGSVGFDLGAGFQLAATDLDLDPFRLELLDPWLTEPLPVGGRVRGNLEVSGPVTALFVDGRLAYDHPEEGIPISTVQARGTVHLDNGFGVTGMSLAVDPLRYPTLRAFLPDLPIAGEGSLRAELSGRLASGMRLTADIQHRLPDGSSSRVTTLGSVQEVDGKFRLSLDATLAPLSFDAVAGALDRELPVQGEVSGTLTLQGFLDDLAIGGRVDTPGGVVVADVRLDALDPFRHYRGRLDLNEYRLHDLWAAAPSPTILSGSLEFDGSGGTAETVEGELRMQLAGSTVGEGQVDEVILDLAALNGRLVVRELNLISPVGTLSGNGELALRDDAEDGEMLITWEAPDLGALRPFLFPGEETIAADTLTPIERDILRMQGIDPDTLVDQAAVPLAGAAYGELHLTGGLPALRADGWLTLSGGAFREGTLEEGRVDFLGAWSDAEGWEAEGVFDLAQLAWGRWAFQRASGEAAYHPGEGQIRLDLQRREDEAYRLRGNLTHDSTSARLDLGTLDLDLEEITWTLDGPAQMTKTGSRYEVRGFRIVRPSDTEGEAVRIEMEGYIDLEGNSDLRVETEGVDLGRLARVAQVEDLPEGVLDFALHISGSADSPRMEGDFEIREFAYGGATLTLLTGELGYDGARVDTRLEAGLDGRRLLVAEGGFPADLSFREVEDRFPDRSVEFEVQVDSLPAATALAYFDFLEGVEGTLDGQFLVSGTAHDLRPSGDLRLRNGALTLPDIGLSPSAISADFSLSEDRMLEVTMSARAEGTARIEGTISLDEPANPTFDLRIAANEFQAVDRRDMSARVGGEMTLTGTYNRPQIGGRVQVEQGALFLEEIARTAEVVDLTDPRIFDDVVDTTLVSIRPIVQAAQNPFLQNLRVDVDLAVQRDFWLRSREMNVEIQGELIVTFDRRGREVLLVGGLEATRGAYTAFGRQFQVEGGTVEFQGTPGINPNLDIRAVNRLRRDGGEPLNIIAQVEGNLMNLRVGLSSDSQPPIAESDLISYLIFGRPSYALASGESSVLQGAAGAGVSAGIGSLASQLGSVFAQRFGVDYLSVTQAQEGSGITSGSGLGSTFADTQIEVGQYLAENVFLALVLRPLTGLGAGNRTQFPGARLEWRFTDLWTAEAFAEDRFAREGASGFGDLGIRLSRVFGFSIYREWGY